MIKRRFLAIALIIIVIMSPSAVHAQACVSCATIAANQEATRALVTLRHEEMRTHITNEFTAQKKYVHELFIKYVITFLQQISRDYNLSLQQISVADGGFVDASEQMASQRVMQEKMGDALKRNQPSTNICAVGTNVGKLAQAQEAQTIAMSALNQNMMSRLLGTTGSSAAEGEQADRRARAKAISEDYCNPNDNNGGLGAACSKTETDEKTNQDIDISQMLHQSDTLRLDFTGEADDTDNAGVMALFSNMFSNKAPFRMSEAMLKNPGNLPKLLDQRAAILKHSVAAAPFMQAVGQMASTPTASTEYMSGVMKGLGIGDDEIIKKELGENPSYKAQMNFLTKKMLQDPSFYVGLQDSPENAARQEVALMAVDQMQRYDTLQVYLSSEMALSALVATELRKQQGLVQKRIDDLVSQGPRTIPTTGGTSP